MTACFYTTTSYPVQDSYCHCCHPLCRSIHIVALGSECPGGVGSGEEPAAPAQVQGGLLWSYLGHGARELDPTSTTPSRHPLNPAFMEYQSRVFGDVRVMVRDCPSWVSQCESERVLLGGRTSEGIWFNGVLCGNEWVLCDGWVSECCVVDVCKLLTTHCFTKIMLFTFVLYIM